jgi:hypothetical protein
VFNFDSQQILASFKRMYLMQDLLFMFDRCSNTQSTKLSFIEAVNE